LISATLSGAPRAAMVFTIDREDDGDVTGKYSSGPTRLGIGYGRVVMSPMHLNVVGVIKAAWEQSFSNIEVGT
jgi:hypothetical protein